MYSFVDTCMLCFERGKNNINILSQDDDGILVEQKLKYVISELVHFKLELIPKNICFDCLMNVNYLFKFKQKCLRNLVSLSEYINSVTVQNTVCNFLILIPNESQGEIINYKKYQPENQQTNNAKETTVQRKTEPEYTQDDIDIKETLLFDEIQTKVYKHEYRDVENNEKFTSVTCEENNQMPTSNDYERTIGRNPEYNGICYNIDITSKPLLRETTNILQNESSNNSDSTPTPSISGNINKSHTCNECQETFTKKKKLTAHIRQHLSEKPHKCELCDKKYSFKKNLIEHMTTHPGSKPYKCDICDKAFINENRLIHHKHRHTGEKPYKCDICLKEFSYETSLLYHKKNHDEKSVKRVTTEY